MTPCPKCQAPDTSTLHRRGHFWWCEYGESKAPASDIMAWLLSAPRGRTRHVIRTSDWFSAKEWDKKGALVFQVHCSGPDEVRELGSVLSRQAGRPVRARMVQPQELSGSLLARDYV